MLNKLYNWSMKKIASPKGEKWLGALSFAEASFFPIPADLLMLPMVLADRTRAWRLATITTLTNVAGAVFGYLIGAFFYAQLAEPIIEFYGYSENFSRFEALYQNYGLLVILAGSLTPLPFKVITIASGVFSLNPVLFIAASLPSRALRYFLGAGLLWYFGPQIRSFIEKRLGLVLTVVTILVIGGFLALKWI